MLPVAADSRALQPAAAPGAVGQEVRPANMRREAPAVDLGSGAAAALLGGGGGGGGFAQHTAWPPGK